VLVEGERISEVILCKANESTEDLMQMYEDWNPMDFEHLCISPGIIDFNLRRDFEDLTQMTRVAVTGGVTFAVEEVQDVVSTEKSQTLFCDVGQIALVSCPSDVVKALQADIFGFKLYLCQPSERIPPATDLTGILDEIAPTGLPLLVDPLLPDLRMYHLASPCHFLPNKNRHSFTELNSGQLFASAYAGEADCSDAEEEEEMVRPIRTQSTSQPSGEAFRLSLADEIMTRQRERKMTDNFLAPQPILASPDLLKDLDYRIRANEQDIEHLSHLEQLTYSKSGHTQYVTTVTRYVTSVPRPPSTLQNRIERLRPSKITVQKPFEENDKDLLYMNYLANFPDHWETLGIKKVLNACADYDVKVHFCNLSSASATNAFLKKKNKNFTCDTATHFLGMTDADIQRGDTRLKCCPPIRNKRNCNLLWELLKVKAIDMITSQHRAVPPNLKFLREGSFKLAVCGVSSLGYALQQVWTKLRIPCASEADMEHYLVRLAKWMSMQPAKLLGVSESRGNIAEGKYADFVIWDPYSRAIASGSNGQFPEVFPYTGQVFYGVIHKVMVKGQVAYESGKAKALGSFVARPR